MRSGADIVWQLTETSLTDDRRRDLLQLYAHEHGWKPSDQITRYPGTEDFCNGHLLIEHGLDNTAVITFLKSRFPFQSLSWREQHLLLAISYNNLVDWHLFPDPRGMLRIYNRTRPLAPEYAWLHDDPNAWRAEAFEQVVGRRPNPNVPSLDAALINTISHWKRVLAADLALVDATAPIAELFNAIFFVRALEDDRRRNYPNDGRLLLEIYQSSSNSIRESIEAVLRQLTAIALPDDLLDFEALERFDGLDKETGCQLLGNFYENRFAPYAYDFSLMSKHALSRIYEHYISVLRDIPTAQKSLFPVVPEEQITRQMGAIYTPQYIARFFARFLKENYTPPRFRSLRTVDPACGSGLFLRTLLEMQCDPMDGFVNKDTAETSFGNVLGVDVDANACKAARLSLTLLHLILTGAFPTSLQINNSDALEFAAQNPSLRSAFDAVIANPPYVRWEGIPREWHSRIRELLGDIASGRIDLYVPFVRLGLDLVRPGGFLLYVLPHAFLIAESTAKLREMISSTCWVRFLVDLSELSVFDDSSSYPILLIAEKKTHAIAKEPDARFVKCAAFAGQALQDALMGRTTESPYYSIYEIPQATFAGTEPRQSHLNSRQN